MIDHSAGHRSSRWTLVNHLSWLPSHQVYNAISHISGVRKSSRAVIRGGVVGYVYRGTNH